jgi:cobalt-zinc-cadmium resistance protein CzcA
VGGEYGQINSIFLDNRFSIQQQMEFPLVYRRSALALEKEYEALMKGHEYERALIKYEIRLWVYRLCVLKERQKWLDENAALWRMHKEKATLRANLGESAALEPLLAEQQQFELSYETEQNLANIREAEQKLFLLCGIREIPELSSLGLHPEFPAGMDTVLPEQHSLLKHYELLSMQYQWEASKEKAKRLPSLGISVADMSMKGTGADDVKYSGSQRFRSAQLSLGIPLFNRNTFRKQHIADIESKKYTLMKEQEKKKMVLRLKELSERYSSLRFEFDERSKTMIPNTRKMSELAEQQFRSGSISMSEYVLMMRQSLNTHRQFLEMTERLNQVIFEYELLHNPQ